MPSFSPLSISTDFHENQSVTDLVWIQCIIQLFLDLGSFFKKAHM